MRNTMGTAEPAATLRVPGLDILVSVIIPPKAPFPLIIWRMALARTMD